MKHYHVVCINIFAVFVIVVSPIVKLSQFTCMSLKNKNQSNIA